MNEKYPPGTRDEHEKFCKTEQWQPVLNAQGRKVRHHATYELVLRDGQILRTRISRPVDRTTYGSSLWGAILKDQLRVTPKEFWGCVNDGVLPDRGAPVVPAKALPLELVYLLTKTAGFSEREVAGMTKEQAIRIMNNHWTSAVKPPDGH